MTEPDDPLAGVDLDAWQPPAPPDGIADAVLRRMNEPVAVAAHELAERSRWRWPMWLGGALVAAAATGIVVVAPWRAVEPPLPARGERGAVVADRPLHLELGASSASSAELDPGATLSWRRDGRLVEIAQLRGAATWRVGGDDTLVIDAGAMGASVEASGASLRVEVDMRITSSDARVVSASAVTAAAVALATVVVYQGHVKVTSAGQTVNVGAGGAVAVKPGEPAREVRELGAVATTAGDAARDPASPARDATGAISPAGAAPGTAPPDGNLDAIPEGSIAAAELELLRTKGNKNIVPEPFVARLMQIGGETRVVTAVKTCVDASGKVARVILLKSSGYPAYDQKIITEIKAWEFKPLVIDGKAEAVCTIARFMYQLK